jgi:hypothetical protein
MKSHVLGLALFSAIVIVASAQAQAQNGSLTRSFVSSAGVDTNACTIAQPCATFAQAYTTVGANGIVAALDPGKYGPITIIGPVTIKGYGWAAITAPASGFGIEVRAGPSDNVTLTGLQVDGAGAGNAGINLDSAGTLTVIDCVFQNFSNGTAIFSDPSGPVSILIKDTILTGSMRGIQLAVGYEGGADVVRAALDEVTVSNNANGVVIYSDTGPLEVLISNSHIDNNTNDGLTLIGNGGAAYANAILKNVTINQTPNPISMNGFSTLWVSQVTNTIVPGFASNGGIIVPNSSTNNTVFSDSTSHIGSSQVAIQAWEFQ